MTVGTYRTLLRSQILPTFAELPLESSTPAMIEHWIGAMDRTAATRMKALAMMHGDLPAGPEGVGASDQPGA